MRLTASTVAVTAEDKSTIKSVAGAAGLQRLDEAGGGIELLPAERVDQRRSRQCREERNEDDHGRRGLMPR